MPNRNRCLHTPIKKLLIFLPESIRSKVPTSYLQDQYLRLYLTPDEYVTITEIEDRSNIQTTVGLKRSVRAARFGFSVNSANIADNKVYAAIRKLSMLNNVASCKKDYNVTVIDYCQPDPDDVLNAPDNTEPFTVRRGVIEVGQHSGTIGYGNITHNNGISFTFREALSRVVS